MLILNPQFPIVSSTRSSESFQKFLLVQAILEGLLAVNKHNRNLIVELAVEVLGAIDINFTPLEAAATGKPVVFIMANIHAGEVEGKEAMLHFMRDVVTGKEAGSSP